MAAPVPPREYHCDDGDRDGTGEHGSTDSGDSGKDALPEVQAGPDGFPAEPDASEVGSQAASGIKC